MGTSRNFATVPQKIVLALCGLQALWLAVGSAVFCAVKHTLWSDLIYKSGFVLAAAALLLGAAKGRLPLRPKRLWRTVFAVALLAVLGTVPALRGINSAYSLLFFAYGAFLTPFYEELIFRGYV